MRGKMAASSFVQQTTHFRFFTSRLLTVSWQQKRTKTLVCFRKVKPPRAKKKELPLKKQSTASIVRGIVENNKMVAVAHYNDMTANEWEDLRHNLHPYSVQCKVIPTKVARRSLDQSVERNISVLFKGPSVLLFGNEPTTLSSVLKVLSEQSKVEVLGGLVDRELFTREGLESLASLPSQSELQSRLVGVAQQTSAKLIEVLKHHQQRLASLLHQYVKEQTPTK